MDTRRDLDSSSNQLKVEIINIICENLRCKNMDVTNITTLKKGMTNRSFLFQCKGKKYIMRLPGEGTDLLINREQEANVYSIIADRNIGDHVVYINPVNGYKLTEFIEGARACNPKDESDLHKCMKYLRDFHSLNLKVNHEFDLFGQIDFYESLWKGKNSIYRDYLETKNKVFELRAYIDRYIGDKVLSHIDAVPDNFLFSRSNGEERIYLIDWEYAAMQDPHVDIAMFGIYSLYNKVEIDRLIDIYFERKCPKEIRIKIYCYISVCGLLWSNWCEYKRSVGVEFGEYSYRQYRYAKDYYELACEEMKKVKG